ncbi:MAG: aquaporin [Buchnera aphidicola (Nurudea yanoniella)]
MSNVNQKIILLVECISEFLGTGLIVFFNSSYIALMQLIYKSENSLWEFSCILGISTCTAIYLSSFISSKVHLNPIITLSFFLLFNFKKNKIIPYIISQTLGSFFSSVIVYESYYDILIKFEKQNKILRGSIDSLSLASIFSFFPNKNIDIKNIFVIETIITFIFVLIIIFLKSQQKFFISNNILSPILIGTLIFILNIIISPLTAFTLNPAQDIGSRLFIYFSGWGNMAFTGGVGITSFIIPILGTIFGTIMSVCFYKFIKFKI